MGPLLRRRALRHRADGRLDRRRRTSTPTRCPRSAREFYSEPVTLTGGVNFAGDLRVDRPPRRRVRLRRLLGQRRARGLAERAPPPRCSAAPRTTNSATWTCGPRSHKSPTAPEWIAERTSTYEFRYRRRSASRKTSRSPSTARRTASAAPSPSRRAATSTGEIGLVGALDAPFGLDRVELSDVKCPARDDAGRRRLAFDVNVDGNPIHVRARSGDPRADFAVEGALTVPRLAAFGGADPRHARSTAVPGADDISLNGVSFSLAPGVFSVGANATIKQAPGRALLTVRTAPALRQAATRAERRERPHVRAAAGRRSHAR